MTHEVDIVNLKQKNILKISRGRFFKIKITLLRAIISEKINCRLQIKQNKVLNQEASMVVLKMYSTTGGAF